MVMPHMSNYNPLEVFDYGMHQGDSIIVKQRVDSMLAKKIFKKKPEWMADDDEWVTHLKVEKVFQNDSLLQVDKQMESEFVVAIQTELGMARIKRHLNKNSIDVKAHEKMYSQVLKEGTGAVLVSGDTIMMDFEVKTLKGKIINSTIDSTFNAVGPKPIILGTHAFPEAIETFLMSQKNGGSFMIYTPAVTLFGATPEKQGLQVDDDISIFLRTVEN
jgi:hypothetical protein